MVLLKPLVLFGMGVSSNKMKFVQSPKENSKEIVKTDAETAEIKLCGEDSGQSGIIQSSHPYKKNQACRYRIKPNFGFKENTHSVNNEIHIRITDLDVAVKEEDPFTCFSNFVAITVNNTHFGPYCGYGSMYQYQLSDSVDNFDIQDSSNGGILPSEDNFFGWKKFKVNENTPIEIVFLSDQNDEGRYGWRIDWKVEQTNES